MAEGGTRQVNRANLGKEFENLVEQAHAVYAVKRIADMKKNPVEWKYTSRETYEKTKHYRQDITAITNTGRYIIRAKSNVDFSGVAGGRYVMFDAKQVSRANFPLGDLANHQLRTLFSAEQCGAVSGLMIYFSAYKRTFFVPASYVDQVCNQMLVKSGKKSIALADCEAHGTEIPKTPMIECDWFSVLIKKI